jgi:hypothetical protein
MEKNMNEETTINRPSTHALAIVSLVLSILGLVWLLPFVGSIGGLVTGYIARREIRQSPGLYLGEGTARAGIILGWIGLAVLFLALCGFLLFMVPFRSSPIIEVAPPVMVP